MLDARQDQAQLLVGAHGKPVARPDVGTENHDAARRQAIEQAWFEAKAGKSEEGRRLSWPAASVDGGLVRCDASVDLRLRPRQCHAVEKWVRVTVMAKRMTLGQCTPRQLRVGGGIAPEEEERGADALGLERVQDFRRSARPWAVVEGEHQPLALSGSVDGKCLPPDARGDPGIHLHDAFGPQRLRIAGAGVGRRRYRDEGDNKELK